MQTGFVLKSLHYLILLLAIHAISYALSSRDNKYIAEVDPRFFTNTERDIQATSDLAVEISLNPYLAGEGEEVVYTIGVVNHGPDDATGVWVGAFIPSGYTYVDHTDGADYDPATGIWTIGELASGANTIIEITIMVNPEGVYLLTATVVGDQEDPNPANNSMSARIQLSDLRVIKSVNISSPPPGQQITFSLAVGNNGPDPATNVTVTDLLPSGFTYVSDNSQGLYDPVTGIWTIGNLEVNDFGILTINATVNFSGNFTNVAEVWADQHDPDYSDNIDSLVVTPQEVTSFQFSKTASDTEPVLGSNITFEISIENTGNTAPEDLLVTDHLPDGYIYLSSTTTSGSDYDPENGRWQPGILMHGQSASLFIDVEVLSEGSYHNTAVLTSAMFPSPLESTVMVFPRIFPVAMPDFVSLERAGFKYVDVLANDSPQTLLDPSTLTITEMPPSGASATVMANGEILLDYGNIPLFVGEDHLIYRIFTTQGLSDTAMVYITIFTDEPEVPNTFAPGSINNPYLVIPGLELYPENELTIYNRWGAVVFNMKGYNNLWAGTDKQSGADLPEGTYFFVLTYDESRPAVKGYVYIKR